MSTTPRSSSPVKPSNPQNGGGFDQSMMVELPTHLGDQTEFIESPGEDVTVKLHSQQQPQSPPRNKASKASKLDQNQDAQVVRSFERQRQMRTPSPQKRRSNRSELQQSPGHLAAFNWEDFEARYDKALQEADEQEKQLLAEFDNLVKYFNIWASASSAHDNERAIKRLQTRERHVRLSEQALSQKKQHLSEVVKAFQSALALLSTT
ncbi:hypothetical protein GGR54DRAFT_69687 [Hypoxylon sp. NC1633]|nr:hypothetical protein GGR54DRAFT_69687 [Hypoxylon sp. NC1633]